MKANRTGLIPWLMLTSFDLIIFVDLLNLMLLVEISYEVKMNKIHHLLLV